MSERDYRYLHAADSRPEIPFYIRRMESSVGIQPRQKARAATPMTAFVYLTDGELLAEADGKAYMCSAGHILLIPSGMPFSVHYYDGCVGYTGGFMLSLLPDVSYPVLHGAEPVHYAFWFDEAAFVSHLFNMLVSYYEQGKPLLLGKGMDMLLSMIDYGKGSVTSPMVSSFLDHIFDRSLPIGNVASCAAELGITPGYLNKLLKNATGRTAGAWIDISRVNLAKSLLRQPDKAVIDVAVAIGLDDQSYFARFFKRNTGMTPSEYRKASISSHE